LSISVVNHTIVNDPCTQEVTDLTHHNKHHHLAPAKHQWCPTTGKVIMSGNALAMHQ